MPGLNGTLGLGLTARPRTPYGSPWQCYKSAVLRDGPVAYWRFGESVGPSAKDSIGILTGTYTASPTLGVASGISGDSDTAVTFNGTTQYVSVPDDNLLDLGDGPLSIEGWLKQGATARWFLSKGTGAYGLVVVTNLYFSAPGGADIAHSSVAVDNSAWHHFVVTKNGAAARIYIDGVDRTVADTGATLVNTATSLFIGHDGIADFMSGSLDDVAIYNKVLSAEQVLTHYVSQSLSCAYDPGGGFPWASYYDLTDEWDEA